MITIQNTQINRKFSLKKRVVQSRDWSYHKSYNLGAAQFPDELLFLSPVLDQDSSDCTAFSSVSTRDSEVSNATFDPHIFWSDELAFAGLKTSTGFDIQTPAAVGVETGFSLTGNPTVKQNQATAYFWVTKGGGNDLFDNVRQAIVTNQRPLMGGLTWYNEYTTQNGIMADNGKQLLGGHCIKIAGFTTKNGIPYLVLQNSWGTGVGDQGKFYMPRDLANKALSQFGVFFWSDDPNAKVKQLGIIQALLQNIVNLYKSLIQKKSGYPPPTPPQPDPTPVTPRVSKIPTWAEAIRVQEGGRPQDRNTLNCNPGNLRGSKYTLSLGATGVDKDNFCIFPNEQVGMQALCTFLTAAASNQLIPYHGKNLQQFTQIYAQPPSNGYVLGVANALKVAINTPIIELL